jgi:hypothetical protein
VKRVGPIHSLTTSSDRPDRTECDGRDINRWRTLCEFLILFRARLCADVIHIVLGRRRGDQAVDVSRFSSFRRPSSRPES